MHRHHWRHRLPVRRASYTDVTPPRRGWVSSDAWRRWRRRRAGHACQGFCSQPLTGEARHSIAREHVGTAGLRQCAVARRGAQGSSRQAVSTTCARPLPAPTSQQRRRVRESERAGMSPSPTAGLRALPAGNCGGGSEPLTRRAHRLSPWLARRECSSKATCRDQTAAGCRPAAHVTEAERNRRRSVLACLHSGYRTRWSRTATQSLWTGQNMCGYFAAACPHVALARSLRAHRSLGRRKRREDTHGVKGASGMHLWRLGAGASLSALEAALWRIILNTSGKECMAAGVSCTRRRGARSYGCRSAARRRLAPPRAADQRQRRRGGRGGRHENPTPASTARPTAAAMRPNPRPCAHGAL